jgi:3'-5' exoribonuclease
MIEWESTDHKYKIYHITRSNLIWNEMGKKYNLTQDYIDEVSHAILAHHGRLEWKSPVEPQTELAWLLHLSDNLSARMCDANTRKIK